MESKTIKIFIITTFIALYFLTSIISTIHVIEFFKLSNNEWLSITLAIAFEIGAAASLASLIALEKMNRGIVWILFFVLTIMQAMGNTYYAFVNLKDFNGWIELFGLVDEELIYQKRILSLVSGAVLPLIALGFIKSLVDYIKPETSVVNQATNQIENNNYDSPKNIELVKTIEEPVEEVTEIIEEPVEEVTEIIEEPVETIEEQPVEEVTEIIEEQPVEEVTEIIEEQPVEEVTETIEESVETIEEQPVEEVTEIIEESVETIEEQPVEEVTEIIEEPVEEVTETIEESVETIEEQPVEEVTETIEEPAETRKSNNEIKNELLNQIKVFKK